eukprot:7165210-Prymnesium_polylepis.1
MGARCCSSMCARSYSAATYPALSAWKRRFDARCARTTSSSRSHASIFRRAHSRAERWILLAFASLTM